MPKKSKLTPVKGNPLQKVLEKTKPSKVVMADVVKAKKGSKTITVKNTRVVAGPAVTDETPLTIEISEKYFKVTQQEPETYIYLLEKNGFKIQAEIRKDGKITLSTPLSQRFVFIDSKPETIQAIGELFVMAAQVSYKRKK